MRIDTKLLAALLIAGATACAACASRGADGHRAGQGEMISRDFVYEARLLRWQQDSVTIVALSRNLDGHDRSPTSDDGPLGRRSANGATRVPLYRCPAHSPIRIANRSLREASSRAERLAIGRREKSRHASLRSSAAKRPFIIDTGPHRCGDPGPIGPDSVAGVSAHQDEPRPRRSGPTAHERP